MEYRFLRKCLGANNYLDPATKMLRDGTNCTKSQQQKHQPRTHPPH